MLRLSLSKNEARMKRELHRHRRVLSEGSVSPLLFFGCASVFCVAFWLRCSLLVSLSRNRPAHCAADVVKGRPLKK